ncbi:hypothetical protein [Kitasatospora sp. A2-31]|uniref:hypothetical protein n=1 Tax=Kitasatospora sp. A2-31 TaxID=2916414 RepID=UPI001EEED7AB|nr:hypothetical protein [Kitasatospora sp. A2-31]MCG6500190.1 hypothetical protein [Kitasatospora sp. A2-31]
MTMDYPAVLRTLTAEHLPSVTVPPDEFRHAGDLTVRGRLVFSSPDPSEFTPCPDVPLGTHPVYAGVTRYRDGTHAVAALLLPLAPPEAVAAAEYEDTIEDYQPLGPDLALLWDTDTMNAARAGDPEAFAEDLRTRLRPTTPGEPICVPVGAPTGERTAAPTDGRGPALAFPVCAEAALCLAGRGPSGELVALLLFSS